MRLARICAFFRVLLPLVSLLGVTQAQTAQLLPTSLKFGNQPVGFTTVQKTVTLTNAGSTALIITGVTTSGDFATNNLCPGSLAPNGSCKINVTFTPTVAGTRTGTLTLTDNAGSGTQTVPLTGTGIPPVALSPASLIFGSSLIGVSASPKTIKLTNNLTFTLALSNMATGSADFTFQNGCGSQVAAHGICYITVTFTPTAAGTRSDALTFSDNTTPATQSIPLTGKGIAPSLVSIAVLPANAKVGIGTTQPYQAIGKFNNNTTSDITASVTWATADPSIASIGASSGLLSGLKGGVTTVLARHGTGAKTITGSTSVTVVPVLTSIAVTPNTATVPAGIPQQFTATGSYNDGSQRDLTTTASWSSSNLTVASISVTGRAATAAPGQTTISAAVGSISGSAVLTVTPASLQSISVTPAGVTYVGVGSNKQYTATGTFTDGSTRPLTNSVVWSSSDPAVATIDSYGLATSTGAGPATLAATAGTVSDSATLSGVSGGFVSCDARILDMQVLVVTSAKSEADFPAITQALDYLGTPYTVLDISTTGNTIPSGSLSNGCHGYFQGVIFTFGSNRYNISNISDLDTYENQFNVRQLNWYVYPDPNFGLSSPVGSVNASSTPYNFHYEAAAGSIFPYTNVANPVGIVNAFIYLSTAANGSTPLLTDDFGNVLAAVYNTPFAGQYLSLTFDSNQDLTHDLVLSYGLINWVTQGMFLGEHHTYFTPQVDDYFIDDSEWTSGLACSTNPDGTGTHIRINAADLSAFLTWQSATQSHPVSSDFIVSMAFNGFGAQPGSYPNDDLTPATQTNQASFNWINHTFDHTNLDNVDYTTAVSEITQNNSTATTLGFTNYNPANMVTPDISGLSDTAFLQAAVDNGVHYLVSDTSRAGQSNPTPNTGIINQLQPSILEIPRHPNNLFFNVASPDDWTAEYTCIYPQLGYNYTQILDNISDSFVANMLKGDLDPEMFHQPNLHAYDGTRSLLGDLIDMTFTKYTNLVNFPILSPTENVIGTKMANRAQYNLAGVTASFIPHQRIMVTAQQTATVPVTGLSTAGAETYDGQTISHLSLTGGQTLTLPLP
jgi:Bacterial Ig-like domain (group 2)/Abnormal spindle-like microcephaly-assoc'd, ASPM-SPD-2-Hydin